MEATPPCVLSGAAMLASLADLTLPHPKLDIPGHTGPSTTGVEDTESPAQLQHELAYGCP